MTSNPLSQVSLVSSVIGFEKSSLRKAWQLGATVFVLSCGFSTAADLVKWDIGTSVASNAGTTSGTTTLGTGVASASVITLTGSVTGTASSSGWRWYDGTSGAATNLATAISTGNYFAWSVAASSGYDLSISGLGTTSFSSSISTTSSSAKLALLYSTDSTFASYTTISTDISIPTSQTDLAAALSGTLASSPITLSAGTTGYFRLAFWGSTSNTKGAIWYGSSATGNDFSLTGTATALNVIHDLTWSGGAGDWAVATSGWKDGASAANWSANDNATINASGSTLTVGAGTTAGSVTVGNTSGDVTLIGSSLTAASLTKTGNGNLILSSSNAFGAVSASGGKVVAGISGALGANSLALDNTILEVTDTTATVALSNSSTTIGANDASFNIGAGASATLSGAVNTAGTSAGAGMAKGDAQTFNTLTKNGDGKLTFSGNVGSQMTYTTGTGAGVTTAGGIALQIAGGSVDLLGVKTLNLASGILLDDLIAGTTYNGMVWNGDIQMNGGTIQINGGNVRGTGTIRAGIAGTPTTNTLAQRLNFNSPDIANNVTIAAGSTLSLSAASGGSIVMLGGISGDGNVTKVGSGTARLDGPNSYTGTTSVVTGILRVGTGTAGTLGTGVVSVASGATIQFNRDDNATISNVISGLGNVTASSLDHTASLTGANTYTGITTITSGKLGASVIDNGGIVSSIGQSTSVAANLVFNGGSLAYEGTADTSSDRNFTLGVNGGGLSATGTGGLNFTSTAAVTTTGASVADTTTSVSSAPTVGQLITGATYQITSTGTTDYTLIGAANSTVDTIFVATGPGAGTGTVRSGLAIGTQYRITTLGTTDFVALGAAASPAPALGTIFIATANGFGDLGGGKVAYANTNTRNFRLGGSGTGRNSVAAAIVNGVPDGVSFNQNITSLTKNGLSTWSITGTNTYTGPTIINSGTLLMDGDNSAATGAVTVLKDCFLGGVGSSGGAVTLADGAGIATKITDWAATDGSGNTRLSIASLNVQGGLGVSIDTSSMVNFKEEAKSFTILNTGGITGSIHTTVAVTAPNFTGNGTWSLAKSGNSVVLSYAVAVTDTTAPVITLKGNATITISVGGSYTDEGATAADNVDSSVTVITTGSVNTAVIGSYTLTYSATDAAGNVATPVTRTVTVSDTTAPVITRNGNATVSVSAGASYNDAGATATDNVDSSVTVNTSGSVNTAVPGTYTLTYIATDAAGNQATPVTRTVTVSDTTAPVITRNGNATISISVGANYTDAGATATDNVDSSVTVTTTGSVNAATAGTYTLTYSATDAAGNVATPVTRTVTVSAAGYSAWASTRVGGAAANVDSDKDGVPNGVEYFMNAASGFTSNASLNGSKVVSWTNGGNIASSAYGTQFVVQTSTDLVTWTDVASNDANLANASGSVSYTVTGAGKRFVRLKVVAQ